MIDKQQREDKVFYIAMFLQDQIKQVCKLTIVKKTFINHGIQLIYNDPQLKIHILVGEDIDYNCSVRVTGYYKNYIISDKITNYDKFNDNIMHMIFNTIKNRIEEIKIKEI